MLALTRLITGLSGREVAIIVVYMALMMAMCILVGTMHRALRVEPTEALRVDG